MDMRVLLAIDGSPASSKAVEYVAGWAGGRNVPVRIVHVLPPVPAALQRAPEHARVGDDASPEGDPWVSRSKQEALPDLEHAAARLASAGVDANGLERSFLSVHRDGSAVSGLLDVAREHGCETIVVGRTTLPWHRELFHHHFADELVRKAEGFTVWVVE